jgi:NitT/TauT family transport system permease protein
MEFKLVMLALMKTLWSPLGVVWLLIFIVFLINREVKSGRFKNWKEVIISAMANRPYHAWFPLPEVSSQSGSQVRVKERGVLRIPRFFGIHAELVSWSKYFLGVLPFLFVIGAYVVVASVRHTENEYDKIVPLPSAIWEAVKEVTWNQEAADTVITDSIATCSYFGDSQSIQSVCTNVRYVREGFTSSLFVGDTLASLKRIMIGSLIGAYLALLLGLNMGMFRGLEALSLPMLTFLSIVNPLAMLPILLIALGVEEISKYTLIAIGVFFPVALTMYGEAKKILPEQKTKSFTLGASELDLVYRVALPQLWPAFINILAISLGTAWIFLVSAEAISASEGLGKRIFLVARTSRMDIIIPYVLWMTFLGMSLVFALKKFICVRYPWYTASN